VQLWADGTPVAPDVRIARIDPDLGADLGAAPGSWVHAAVTEAVKRLARR
jgi:hypothetical protein